jgi:hypothetical protein
MGLKMVSTNELLQDKGTQKPLESRIFAGHIAPKSFSMGNFTKFLPTIPFVQIQLFHR